MVQLNATSTIAAITVGRGASARVLLVARGLDDLNEAPRVETGAADQGTVDIRLAHQFLRVLWFHTAAVLNAHSFGRHLISHFVQGVADEGVGLLRLSGRRIA